GVLLVSIGIACVLLETDGDEMPAQLTEAWWHARPLWLVSVLVIVGLLVAVVGRREAAADTGRPATPTGAPSAVIAVLLTAVGVVLVLVFGASAAAWFGGALLLVSSLRLATRGAVS